MSETPAEPESPERWIPVSSDPERMSPAGWVYPTTWQDRLARWSRPLLRGVLCLAGVLVLVLVFLWAVPSLVVARRASYAAACQRAQRDAMLTSSLGAELTCPRVPDFYRLDQQGGDTYEWWVEGPRGRAQVHALVKDGKVLRFRVLQVQPGWF